MYKYYKFSIVVLVLLFSASCHKTDDISSVKIAYLHHSTGGVLWRGGHNPFAHKVIRKLSQKLSDVLDRHAVLPDLFKDYNKEKHTKFTIEEREFPKEKPYGWKNYPYDYYNIWVRNAGDMPYMEEPTLEMLTKEYQVITFKHCFPVSNIKPDQEIADIDSETRTIANYKMQYLAIRDKLHEFPDTKFILFTGAAQTQANTNEESATRAKDFFTWVTNEWDVPGDNIYLWDLYSLQTEGGLYFKDEYAVSSENSHPNKAFASRVVKLLFDRIIDIIENEGDTTMLSGERKPY